jgi:hypothetical protein
MTGCRGAGCFSPLWASISTGCKHKGFSPTQVPPPSQVLTKNRELPPIAVGAHRAVNFYKHLNYGISSGAFLGRWWSPRHVSLRCSALLDLVIMFQSYGHISFFASCLNVPVSLGSLFQGIASIYDRLYLPRLKKIFEED